MHVILVNGKTASLFSDKDADLVVKDCTVFNYTDPSHGSYADTIVFDNRTGNRYRPASKTDTAVIVGKQAIGNINLGEMKINEYLTPGTRPSFFLWQELNPLCLRTICNDAPM
jgi:hypothetical protein